MMFEKVSAAIVFLGFDKTISEFREIMKTNDLISSLQLTQQKIKFNIVDENNDCPAEVVNNIKENFPIAIFSNDNIEIMFLGPQQKLLLKAKNYNQLDVSIFVKIALFLYSWNMTKIKKVGINFSSNETFVNQKLKLLNPEIEKTEDWNKNVTFILTIPYKYDNYIANYKIQKLVRENEEDTTDRVYQISVNFDFDLKRQNSTDNSNILEDVDSLYNKFKKKGNEFFGLIYD